VVVIGTGALARLLDVYLAETSEFEVAAFAVDREYLQGETTFAGRPLVAFEDVAATYPPSEASMFVAVGYRKVNRARAELYRRATALGYTLITYVHPTAYVHPSASIGSNCLIFERVVIQPFAQVGDDVIIWSNATVAHDSVVGDHCFIAPGAAISGNVVVGELSFIGINATVRDGVHLAPSTVVGAGALIKRDTTASEIYSPSPTQASTDRDSSMLDNL
jgi:sugar O-acyltransferase (sialic acid O-acetyltransferase NeuD family)